ncbi:MAG: serpin family protein [Bacteroidales bacterium]|nr:serpin family protein [Bacteroidales bacterium]
MKKTLIMAIAGAAAMISCGPKYVAPTAEPGSEIAYSMSFIRSVASTVNADENLVISPYSAGVALSMLAEGAEGETKAEFSRALNDCIFKAEDLGGNDTVTVNSVNSLWVDDNFSVRNRYVNLMQKDFDALVTTLNFGDPATVKAINNWCSEHTNGKITEIIDELGRNVVMVLVNALYFNAPWLNPFDEHMTFDAPFYGSVTESKVKMMSRKAYMNYAEYMGCQLVELPYEGGRYTMYVLLPPKDLDMNEVIGYLSEDAYKTALASLQPTEVQLRMPKVKAESSLLLNDSLQKMGIRTAFSAAADFSGIAEMGPLVLDQVRQKCYVEISEKGTEAAAVTSAQIRLTSARPSSYEKMTVDRPFVFFIADTQKDNIMFAGRIMNL